MNKATLGLISIVLLAACGGRDGSPTVRLEVEAAPAVTAPVEVEAVIPALPETVEAKISAIRDVLARDSLSRLVRLADAEESFVSNLAGEPHRVHWDLLRRTGFDPLLPLFRNEGRPVRDPVPGVRPTWSVGGCRQKPRWLRTPPRNFLQIPVR